MAVSIKSYTDSSFVFSNSAGSGAGGWAVNNDVAAYGGSVNKTTVTGDKVTISWTGRCLYLFIVLEIAGSDFTVTTDGVLKTTKQTCLDITGNSSKFFRVPVCIERELTDGAHVTVLQSVTGSSSGFYINASIVVSGAKVTKTANIINCCGDSWTAGIGMTGNRQYTAILQRLLTQKRGVDVVLNNKGLSGSGMICPTGQNLLTAFEQVISSAANAPEILSIAYGTNDLRTYAFNEYSGQYVTFMRTLFTMIDDIYDTTSVKVAVCTPGYVPSYQMANLQANTVFINSNSGYPSYKLAVNQIRNLANEFSWLTVADWYLAMDKRTELVFPNSAGDVGVHPNNAGHYVLAETIYQAVS